jgi:23S rRNA (cytosine1962-C5)-methyltransferase
VAFESLQRSWFADRTLYRGDRYLIVDKPAGISCRPVSVAEAGPNADVQGEPACSMPSLSERLEQQGYGALSVLGAVPARGSGAVLFGLGATENPRSSSQELPAVFRTLECVVGIDDCRLPASGRLPVPGIAGANGEPAQLEYRVLQRHGSRTLVEARGRLLPDQLVDAFARARQAPVGVEAASQAATRMLVHVRRLEADAFIAAAPLPAEFEAWLRGAAVRPPRELAAALLDASLVRAPLWGSYGAFRLIGDEGGEIAGLTLDRYGAHAVLGISSDEAWELREQLAECVMDHGAHGVYLKRLVRADLRGLSAEKLAPPGPFRGSAAPEAFSVQQAGLAFSVSLGDGLSTGLFLDQRANWARFGHMARGAKVLNLFCYTGAFSIAAGAGGASSTVSVDLSARALARTHQNLELNGLAGAAQRLHKDDVLRWLARAERTARRFDRIVLDPPSFGTRAQGVLRADRDYAGLVRSALALLEPGGQLLCVSHQRGFTIEALSELVLDACQALGREGRVETWPGDWDCPSLPGVSGTKSVLARLS